MAQRLAYDELAIEEQFRHMTRRLRQPQGRRRDASIVGLYMDALRHKDGSLTVAYEVAMPSSMFSDDQLVDIRYDDMARMLAFDKPSGTLVQFRYATTPDPGHAINSVIASRARAGNHVLAGLLQASNLDWLRTSGKLQPFRRSVLTMWVRVPPKQRGNSTIDALGNFKGALLLEKRKHGVLHAAQNIFTIYSRTADDSVVRNTLEDEARAYQRANTIWRQVENSSPLTLRRFSRQELWEAVFFGHCQNALSAPILPERPGCDLRSYLCAETIEGDLNYLMHGQYPVAIVSLFTPPNESVTADALRGLIGRRDFNSRHTIVTEYLFPEQRKETKRLDRRIRQVKRTFTKRDNPEGAAALRSLRAVRDEVAGARESLLPTRFYVILHGDRATNLAELKRSLNALDEQCERVIAAIRQIPGAEVIEEMIKRLPGDGYSQLLHVSEVALPLTSGWVLLGKENFALRTRHRPPTLHSPLERA